MRRSIRRFFRRHRRFQVYLALLSTIQLIFPQHVSAGRVIAPADRPAEPAIEAPQLAQRDETVLPLPVATALPIRRVERVTATAYSSSFDETDGDPFTTASGARVRDGIVAANGLPFGTKLRIPDYYGDRVFTVLDRMNSRYGRGRVDIWMPSKAEAKEWGVRSIRIEVL